MPEAKRKHSQRPTGYSCVGLGADTVYGNFYSYENFVLETPSAEALNSTLTHEEYPLVAKIIGGNIQGFTGESVSRVKRITCNTCTFYSGACIHTETGFCMDEVPGTAQCLEGFRHCNEEFFCNTLNTPGCVKK